MPIYEYICSCGYEFDEMKKIEDRYNVICEKCGEVPKKKVSKVNFDSGVIRDAQGKDMAGTFNVGLGEPVSGKSDLKAKAKAKGLRWIGDDPVPKQKEQPRKEPDWNAVAYDLEKSGVKN